jgi:hypothetical protein
MINETGEDGIALNINFVVPRKKPEPIDITPPTPDPYAGARRSQSQGNRRHRSETGPRSARSLRSRTRMGGWK